VKSSSRSIEGGGGIDHHNFFIIRHGGIIGITRPETEDFQRIPMKIRDRSMNVTICSLEEGTKNGVGRSGTNFKSGE